MMQMYLITNMGCYTIDVSEDILEAEVKDILHRVHIFLNEIMFSIVSL
jgi:hypothetical protein